jgi:hypothetical protein
VRRWRSEIVRVQNMEVRVQLEASKLKQRSQGIVINMARRCYPMNKLSGANVLRLLNLFLVISRFKVCLFARIGHHRPCLRLHCLCLT